MTKVYSYLGWEQEYFLVDEGLYSARTDLMITGRTLFGHNSSKNQQLDDHYFAAIPPRVAAFMRELEITGHRLIGLAFQSRPATTRSPRTSSNSHPSTARRTSPTIRTSLS